MNPEPLNYTQELSNVIRGVGAQLEQVTGILWRVFNFIYIGGLTEWLR